MVEPGGALRRGWGRVLSLLVASAVAGSVIATASAALAAQAAAIVVDAKTGKVLYSSSPDARTYPASLTKMMTLFLLFDALDSGKTTLSSKIPITAHAAAQAPSKLGLKPGQTITVRDAILAVVTKSANDVACAIGEYLGGSEGAFAARMTSTAHAIGMSNTTFRNASGLPDSSQMTTARDMALLGRALRDRFPRYFPYFSTASFAFGKQRIPNHNHLLGHVPGVNGIKTGYTVASGYNLVTSVDRDGRQVIAVVLGGRTGKARDQRMIGLINDYMPKASTGSRTAALVGTNVPASAAIPVAPMIASAVAPVSPVPPARPKADPSPEPVVTASVATVAVDNAEEGDGGDDSVAAPDAAVAPAMVPNGWKIQLGAAPNLKSAKAILSRAKDKAPKLLASASGYTEPVNKGSSTLYRARFGGFKTKESARAVCTYLAKQDFSCLALQ